jgi:aspartyl protease family protein
MRILILALVLALIATLGPAQAEPAPASPVSLFAVRLARPDLAAAAPLSAANATSVALRLRAPTPLRPILPARVTIAADGQGHYIVDARVNGLHMISFVIDTGATMVLLGRNHAEMLRVYPRERSAFTAKAQTANGIIDLAPVKLNEIRIGRLSVFDVDALVGTNDQPIGLLGMSFMRKLNRFEMRHGQMILE